MSNEPLCLIQHLPMKGAGVRAARCYSYKVDVSRKGIPAALLMSTFRANLHALIDHSTSLSDLANTLNDNVFKSANLKTAFI